MTSGYEKSPDYGGPELRWPTVILVVAVMLLVGLLAVRAFGAPISKDSFTITDGDTIHVKGEQLGTRLVGFNAPESNLANAQCVAEVQLGKRVTDRLRALVNSARVVDLTRVACSCPRGTQNTYFCNYGRSCAALRVDGRDVGSIWISDGLASPLRCGATSCPPLQRPWCR